MKKGLIVNLRKPDHHRIQIKPKKEKEGRKKCNPWYSGGDVLPPIPDQGVIYGSVFLAQHEQQNSPSAWKISTSG